MNLSDMTLASDYAGEPSQDEHGYPSAQISVSDFTPNHPEHEGAYLWLSSLGISLIHTAWVAPKTHGGVTFEAYLGVVEHRGRHIEKLSGKFLRLELFE